MPAAPFEHVELLPLGKDATPYRLVTRDGVEVVKTSLGEFLKVDPSVITRLTSEAMRDIAHFLRPGHLQQLANILADPTNERKRTIRTGNAMYEKKACRRPPPLFQAHCGAVACALSRLQRARILRAQRGSAVGATGLSL